MGILTVKNMTAVTVSGTTSTLANNARVKVGTLDNTNVGSSNLGVADWTFRLATGFSVAPTPAAGIVVNCYAIPITDGTNSATVDTSTPLMPANAFVGAFQVVLGTGGTATQYLDLDGIRLNALKYDIYIDNQSGQTMAASWTFTAAPTEGSY